MGCGLAQGLNGGPNHPQQHQGAKQQGADGPGKAAGQVLYLWLFPKWQIYQYLLFLGKRRVHEVDRVPSVLVEANRLAHQRGHFFNLLVGQRRGGGLALGVRGALVVQHHGRADALDHARAAPHHSHGLVHFVIGDGFTLAAGIGRRAVAGRWRQGLCGAIDGGTAGGWRLVGGGARHAGCGAGAAVAAFYHLLAANHR